MSRDYVSEPLQVLSFGAGTQSTAMLILAAEGVLKKPELVMFADTGSETAQTYAHVQNWAKPFCNQHQIPFEVVRSSHGSLHEHYLKKRNIPMIGIAKCTMDFKITPIRKRLREIVGKKNGKVLVHAWLGITMDEEKRRQPGDVKWVENVFPFLDELKMTRRDCISLLADRGVDVGKSGCWLCPYQKKRSWLALKTEHPELFDFAASMEEAVQERLSESGRNLHVGFMGEKVRLRTLQQIPDLWSFEEKEVQCSAGACFI